MTEPESDIENKPFAFFGEKGISFAYLFKSLRIHRELPVLNEVIRRFAYEQLFEEQNITASDDEIVEYMDQFRESEQLYDDSSTGRWLKQYRMSDDDMWEYCALQAKLEKLKEKATAEFVEEKFALEKANLEQVELFHIITDSDSLAREIKLQVQEGEDFSSLARATSVDEETRKIGGYLGFVRRQDFLAETEAAVFGAKPGQVVGPIKGARGYHLYFVKSFKHPSLDEETRKLLVDDLFNSYMQQVFEKHGVKIEMLEFKDGKDGKDDRDGKDGKDGKDDRDGKDGKDDRDGKDSIDGNAESSKGHAK